jgi:DNA polymerase III gamma/tau subunit
VLTYDLTASILGRSTSDDLTVLCEAMISDDVSNMIKLARIQYDRGKDVSVLVGDLIELFRSGMLYATMGDEQLLDLPQNEIDWLKRLTNDYGASKWIQILESLMAADQKVRYATHPWIAFELALVKMNSTPSTNMVADLVKRIEMIEQKSVTVSKTLTTNYQQREEVKSERIQKPEYVNHNQANQNSNVESSSEEIISCGDLSLDQIKEKWDLYMNAIKGRLVSTYALMKEVKPVSFKNDKLQLQLNEALKILKPAIENEDNMYHITQAFKDTFGALPKIEIIDYALEDTRVDEVKSFFKDLVDDDQVIIK